MRNAEAKRQKSFAEQQADRIAAATAQVVGAWVNGMVGLGVVHGLGYLGSGAAGVLAVFGTLFAMILGALAATGGLTYTRIR